MRRPAIIPPVADLPPPPSPVGMALLAVYLVALLYSIGWSYAANFFAHFQVGMAALQLPWEYVFSYSYFAVKLLWWVLLLFALFILTDLFLLWWLGAFVLYQGLTRQWRTALWSAMAVLLLLLGAKFGEISARQAFEHGVVAGFPEMAAVRVVLKPVSHVTGEAAADRQVLARSLQAGCYRLLHQEGASGTLFLFRYIPGLPVTGFPLEIIRQKEVSWMRLLPQPVTCEVGS